MLALMIRLFFWWPVRVFLVVLVVSCVVWAVRAVVGV